MGPFRPLSLIHIFLIAENGSNVILSRDEIKLGEPVTALSLIHI